MKRDVNEKYYLNDRYRIADLLNGYFFHGIQYIAPEDVKEAGTQLVYVAENHSSDSAKDDMTVLRDHDLLHKIIHGANYFIFSLEDQNYLDPSMVLRSLEYTVGEYVRQRHEIQKMHDRKKDLKGDEYLSRLYFVKCFSQKSERKIPNFRNGIFPYISRKHFHMIVVQSVA